MNRRGLLLGLSAVLAAPAIVRADSLMKIAVLRETVTQPVAGEHGELWKHHRIVGYYTITPDRNLVRMSYRDGAEWMNHEGPFSFSRVLEISNAWGVKPYDTAA